MKKTIASTIAAALLLCILLPLNAHADGRSARAVTNWLVIFNDPSECLSAPCTDADFGLPNNEARIDVCYLTGQVVRPNGRATFAASFAEGSNFGCIFSALGLEDADNAEMHIVAQEHGKALKTGKGLEEQVLYFLGACNPECVDTQFAVHWSGSDETVNVYRFADGSKVRRATSTLYREGDGVRIAFHTRFDRMHHHQNDED